MKAPTTEYRCTNILLKYAVCNASSPTGAGACMLIQGHPRRHIYHNFPVFLWEEPDLAVWLDIGFDYLYLKSKYVIKPYEVYIYCE